MAAAGVTARSGRASPHERTRERRQAVHALLEQGHGLLERARCLGWGVVAERVTQFADLLTGRPR